MGGLELPNLNKFNEATWIRRYLTGNGHWKNILNFHVDFNKILNTGIESIQNYTKSVTNVFWKKPFKHGLTYVILTCQKINKT